MSQLFTSGGQSIGASASPSVLPMNIQSWFPLGSTGLISLQSKGFSRVFGSTTVWKHQFLIIVLTHIVLPSCASPWWFCQYRLISYWIFYFLSFILVAWSMEISLSYWYCKTNEDRDHPFSVFLSALALSMILAPYSKHSSFFVWGFARVIVMVFLSLSLFFFFLTLIQIIRRGCSWTGKKRRVNLALFCARREKNLTTDFFFTNTKSRKNLRHTIVTTICGLGFPSGSAVESACIAGDTGEASSVLGSGISPGRGIGSPLQYSCLGNLRDRGA